VQRPGLAATIAVDLVVLSHLTRGLARVSTPGSRARLVRHAGEFRATLRTELDSSREAAETRAPAWLR